jgi:uncharacterized protein (AIM24 family)
MFPTILLQFIYIYTQYAHVERSTLMKYRIIGDTLPVVICDVEPGETLITESGAMSWMTQNMKMDTTSNGGFGKALGRMFSGDTLFQNKYTAQGGPGQIAFASSFPGHTFDGIHTKGAHPLACGGRIRS